MVYVIPDSLKITPVDPYNTDQLTAVAHIKGDWFSQYCGAVFGYTKTYIHLLRRNVSAGETWIKAQEISVYDCYTQCCLDQDREEGGAPGSHGYNTITFDSIRAMPVGVYEFMAVDDEDFKKGSYQVDRVAKFKVEVQPNPTAPPVVTPSVGTTTECDEGDYLCSYKNYLPYVAIGIVLVGLLMSGGRKHR